MPDTNDIVRERQLLIRRQLDARGITLKGVSFDSGVKYSTLLSYFPGEKNSVPAVMSVAALYSLCGAIPDDLMSLLLPQGRVIVQVPEGADWDEISSCCRSFIDAKDRAHHPESEAGRDIGPNETDELARNVVRLRA